jgi:hypothetical protein
MAVVAAVNVVAVVSGVLWVGDADGVFGVIGVIDMEEAFGAFCVHERGGWGMGG